VSRAKDSQERPARREASLSKDAPPQAPSRTNNVRAIAANSLARIVRGASLRTVFAQAAPQLHDARDRALKVSSTGSTARRTLEGRNVPVGGEAPG
jgi:hypothetical protein